MVATDTEPIPLDRKHVDQPAVADAVASLLYGLGQDDKTEVMANTPRRVAELWDQFINPPDVDVELPLKTFANPGMTGMVIVNDVHYVSVCEHHLAAAFGVAHLAYVPGERVVGYSKLKKALNYFARRPTLNERLVVEVRDAVLDQLQPDGLAVVLRSVHTCIALRTNAPAQELVTVSEYSGCLADGPLRAAFDATWSNHRPSFLGA
jgi:GTP cyclohydrolase I